jgi:hypothetical protein
MPASEYGSLGGRSVTAAIHMAGCWPMIDIMRWIRT